MNDEFIIECTKCSKHSLHSLDVVRSLRKQNHRIHGERTQGNVDCPHCKSVVELLLEKCYQCGEGWSSFKEEPNKTKRGAFGETTMMWLGTICPSCYPEAREDVINYGEIRPRG